MQGFLISLLICSVTMSVLALLYVAVTPLLAKRYAVAGRYYAWLVLVIGLIIPFRPPFSHAMVSVGVANSAAVPTIQIGNGAPVSIPASVPNTLPAANPVLSWWQIGVAVWLVGMVLFLAYHGIQHMRFLKLAARWSDDVTDPGAWTQLQDLKTQMGLTRTIGMQVCHSIGSPMMVGFTHPKILLPSADFAAEELRFILKHELVHYKRRDLWYKGLVLLATAIHWFNPVVYLMAKTIGIQCELSCDEEVVRGTDADTRQSYSETIIGVVRYRSRLKTALSTTFYGGKKGMKARIFSIMDMSGKKAGAAVLFCALLLTLGTGATLRANAEAQAQPAAGTAQLPISMLPDPQVYAPYAAFGLTITEDGAKLLYGGQPVRLFRDEGADMETFYFDGAGSLNLSAVRSAAGAVTGIEPMTADQARESYEHFFAEELEPGFFTQNDQVEVQDFVGVVAKEEVQQGGNKYEQYEPFGLSYSLADEILYYQGQRVKFFVDQPAGAAAEALWEDDAGTVNAAVVRDASGQITGIEPISEDEAQAYRSGAEEYHALAGLEDRVEARVNARHQEG